MKDASPEPSKRTSLAQLPLQALDRAEFAKSLLVLLRDLPQRALRERDVDVLHAVVRVRAILVLAGMEAVRQPARAWILGTMASNLLAAA
jgi:hypothetical protein